MSRDDTPVRDDWAALQRYALIAGGVGLALCALGALLDVERLLQAWLVAFLFWLAFPLGGAAVLLVHHQTGGRWGMGLRRVYSATGQTLPLLALYFVPIALGVYYLYPWTDPSLFHGHEQALLKKKEPYLNVTFFLVRAAVYFAVWFGVVRRQYVWARAQDEHWDPAVARKMQVFSGPAMVLYGLTVTFAAVDWIMSLEPLWYSSIFGALIAAAQLLPAFAFGIIVLAWLTAREARQDAAPAPAAADPYDPLHAGPVSRLSQVLTPTVWNDLGNLLLAFVMIWSYLTFSQFFLIWSGNLPEEIAWYVPRMNGGWEFLGWALIVFYFALPFLGLLMRDLKRRPERLVWIAGTVLVMHYVYTFWLVIPSFGAHGAGGHGSEGHRPHFHASWMDLAALVGLGGVWLAAFLWRLRTRALLPLTDPALLEKEAAHHG